ncbi:uncharacterized protein LOC135949489 [Calliphora vicina]|uniref:uncharacterized protein LOC135949489 n=1 Tax=Calliphora vicina TaxID=7373 RepID=UPI00325AB5F8
MAFGQHMINNGKSYELLRKLEMLEDRSVNFNREDTFDLIRKTRKEKIYNLRSKEVNYTVGQEVYRRNFKQSNFEKGFNAKLAPPFVKARIRKKTGTCYYELEDLTGRLVGVYHAKDIRQ